MGVLDFFFRRSSPARPAPQGADREIVANPYIVEVNEQLEAYMAIHRFVTTEVRDYQERENQGTPAQAGLAGIFFEACGACGSGTPPVELLEQTQMIFNQLAHDGRQQLNDIQNVLLKLDRISCSLVVSPSMMLVSDQEHNAPSDCGLQSLAGCFADSFWYAHAVLDSVSGNQPDSKFVLADWTIPPKARRIMEACAHA